MHTIIDVITARTYCSAERPLTSDHRRKIKVPTTTPPSRLMIIALTSANMNFLHQRHSVDPWRSIDRSADADCSFTVANSTDSTDISQIPIANYYTDKFHFFRGYAKDRRSVINSAHPAIVVLYLCTRQSVAAQETHGRIAFSASAALQNSMGTNL